MFQELNLIARPDLEAIAQLLGQRDLSFGTQDRHRWSLARMTHTKIQRALLNVDE
jgi:hypothetical protein